MANPNIVTVTDIRGKTAVASVTTTASTLVENPSASNKVFKLNALIISNIDGTNNSEITIDIYRNTVAYHLVKTLVVPADASIDVLSKSVYLEEGDALRITAADADRLQAVCSYEEIL
jgi:hypothetical protein